MRVSSENIAIETSPHHNSNFRAPELTSAAAPIRAKEPVSRPVQHDAAESLQDLRRLL